MECSLQYLLILVVLAIVIGPIMWIMPSASQRKLVQLRQYALSKGFQIKVADMPQSHRQKVRQEEPVRGVHYLLPLINKPKAGTEKFLFCLTRSDSNLEWIEGNIPSNEKAMIKLLEQMPDSAVAVEHASHGVAVYWRERGGEESVDLIASLLEAFRQSLT